METRRVWILEPAGSPHGTVLGEILGAAGGFECRRELLADGVLPQTLQRPGSGSAGLPSAAGFLVVPEGIPGEALEAWVRGLSLPVEVPWFLIGDGLEPAALVSALRGGFTDFLLPPLRGAELLPRLQRHLEFRAPENSTVQELKERIGLGHIIGQSPALVAELKKIPAMARCEASVLIAGETGTGKEACARAIHYLGPRSRHPFVAVNCGAIPADLIENELFGHDAGAFTGATSARAGLVEEAAGGTLFLDEVDSLPLSAQVKLLRLLQEKEFRHLGSRKTCRADVRVVASANTDLEAALRQRRFRADLYYRLNVLPLKLPPLRERPEDLPQLAAHFATRYAREFRRPPRHLTTEALACLAQHHWPGNVRELENVIERAVLLTEGPGLQADDLAFDGAPETFRVRITLRAQKSQVVERFERDYLTALLARHEGNISRAAVEAGKNRRALFELLRRHRLNARDFAHLPVALRAG